jgi:translation elongation factor EF-Ts
MENIEKPEMIIKLRVETGYGLMLCKHILIKYNWNYELAIKNAKQFDPTKKLIHNVENT